MKIILKFLLTLTILFLMSCSEKTKEYPSINFIGGDGLISQNSILKRNTNFKVGINSFTNGDSPLYKFTVTRIYDNFPQVIIDSTINIKNFNTIITFPTQDKENTERWIFSISCKNGYTSEISMLIKTCDSTSNITNKEYSRQYILTDIPNEDYRFLFYIGLIVLLILAIIVYKIIPKKKKEYNVVKLEYINKLKKDIIDEIKVIENFINKKTIKHQEEIDNYKKQIENLETPNGKINKFLIYAGTFLMIIFILSIIIKIFFFSHYFIF